MRASIQLNNRAPPTPRKRPTRQPVQTPSLDDCVREIEHAIAEIIVMDKRMTDIEQAIQTYRDMIDIDDWDTPRIEQSIADLSVAWGGASTLLVIAVNSVIWHGRILIDEWRDDLLDNIARQYSACASFYRRVQQEWPEVAKRAVWQRFQQEGVPF